MECFNATVSTSPCSVTNITCLCTDNFLEGDMATCLQTSCRTREIFLTKNITMTACDAPTRDKSTICKLVVGILGILSSLFVIQRLAFKIYSKTSFGPDDWFTLTSCIANIPLSVLILHAARVDGLGRDIWTLPYDRINDFRKIFYVFGSLYFFEIAILRLAMLFFYLRIFPAGPIRRLLWGTALFNCLTGLTFIITALIQCLPISYSWTNWDGEHEGRCININAYAWSAASISISLDLWILAIPLSQVRALKLNRREKLSIAIMFSVGAFFTIMSVLRLHSLIKFKENSTNPTWEFSNVAVWSSIEVNVGIICNCMPTFRLLLVRIFPKLLGKLSQNGSAQMGSRSGLEYSSSRRFGTGRITKMERHSLASQAIPTVFSDNDEVELVEIRDIHYKSARSDYSHDSS
ncbi:putative PTH11-typeG-protein-coupled receptor [Mariannaea sp. PMI_226]|nr:putative PTH11-typeG-protein-coupled receptor [Mariannaea sp. PMI_226]